MQFSGSMVISYICGLDLFLVFQGKSNFYLLKVGIFYLMLGRLDKRGLRVKRENKVKFYVYCVG